MANPFIKAWKYLMAKFDYTVEQDADPAIQIEQAIAEVKRHHQELSQQAVTIIGNQRQLEMKLDRQLSSVENIKNNVRQALLMAEDARRKGHAEQARDYEKAANAFSEQLVSAEKTIADLKVLHEQTRGASDAARAAVEQNARLMEHQLAERTKLLNQLDQVKMQEKVAQAVQQINGTNSDSSTPSLEHVRDKIESRHARAIGQTELADSGVAQQMMEVEAVSAKTRANTRLAEIRAEMAATGELPQPHNSSSKG